MTLLFVTIKLDIDNDELQAYLTEWIFEQVDNYFDNE